MNMQAGFSVLALLLAGCATATSDWAVLGANESDRVELVSQSGVPGAGNDAKAQQTALRSCESKGYARAIEVDDRAMDTRRVVTFECRPARDEHPVAFNGTLKK